MLPNLDPVRRYQAELDAARDDAAQSAAALARLTVEVDSFRGLLETSPPDNDEEARDQRIHAQTLAVLEQRQAELIRRSESALARLNCLESELPAISRSLVEYLLKSGAERDYRDALAEFQEAAARYRLLRDAFTAWNSSSAATGDPLIPGDALYQEQRRLADQGIRLSLRPDHPAIGPPPAKQRRPELQRKPVDGN